VAALKRLWPLAAALALGLARSGPWAAAARPSPGPAEAALFARRCGVCHPLPNPGLHTAQEWPRVLERMQMRMRMLGRPPLSDEETADILAYLQAYASPG